MTSVMHKSKIVQQLRELNVIERLNIITDMWDEIKESRELEFVSDEEKKLLLNREAANEFLDVIPWHENILLERENLIRDGRDEFVDWDQVKKAMRKLISLKSKNRKLS